MPLVRVVTGGTCDSWQGTRDVWTDGRTDGRTEVRTERNKKSMVVGIGRVGEGEAATRLQDSHDAFNGWSLLRLASCPFLQSHPLYLKFGRREVGGANLDSWQHSRILGMSIVVDWLGETTLGATTSPEEGDILWHCCRHTSEPLCSLIPTSSKADIATCLESLQFSLRSVVINLYLKFVSWYIRCSISSCVYRYITLLCTQDRLPLNFWLRTVVPSM